MDAGTVAADWRQRRTAVHIRLPEDALFLDAESPKTHQFLRQELRRSGFRHSVSVTSTWLRYGDRTGV